MDTWDIHIAKRMSGVDPIRHIQNQAGKETYTFKSLDFLINDNIKNQIENHVMGWFQTGLKNGPHTHAWRLVGKIFLHWPTFKDRDFENPICVVYQNNEYKIMTGITRLWARCIHDPNYSKTKALIFHSNSNFAKDKIDSLDQAQDLFLNPVNDLLVSVDYWPKTHCYFVNEFDTLDRKHMMLFTGKGNATKEFEKYWTMLHETSKELALPKFSREHIIQGSRLLLSRI